MTEDKFAKLRELLDENHLWPDYYTFKFIVRTDLHEKIITILEGHEITLKPSEKGNYISITARKLVVSTDEVIAIYQMVGQHPGVMSF